MAVEWGGQTVSGLGNQRFNFALASGLSTVCQLLDIDLAREHNTGPNPFWGQTGHYSIASAAIDAVQNPRLKSLLLANIEQRQIRRTRRRPGLVWKKTPARVPGGRDYAQNAGPEHQTHYADIDQPDGNGQTLRDLTHSDIGNMDVTFKTGRPKRVRRACYHFAFGSSSTKW